MVILLVLCSVLLGAAVLAPAVLAGDPRKIQQESVRPPAFHSLSVTGATAETNRPPRTVPLHEQQAKRELLARTCTLSKGFWKNHPSLWPTSIDPNANFFSTGQSWLVVLWTPPRGENSYYVLAHQYIATALNQARGIGLPEAVQKAFSEAHQWLATHTPHPPRTDTRALELAATLERFNDGQIGPPACPDEVS